MKMKKESINAEDFRDFIQELWTFCKAGDVLFMDSCTTHWAHIVQETISKKTGFCILWNMVGRPDLSGIELWWNCVK